MKNITINGENYILEYTFEAAQYRDLVQTMFNIKSGSFVAKRAVTSQGYVDEESASVRAMFDGVSDMVAEVPHVCITAFYAGLLENNPVTQVESKILMKTYMKENNLTFDDLYNELNSCMEDDGFFDLSGLTATLKQMNEAADGKTKKPAARKKSASTK